ncbi:MAG TPA: Na+/H+ antiporter [Gemmatimonadales bacterium]|nr:Na+/H+ antiporter [Gemmatimonadales bacterium]
MPEAGLLLGLLAAVAFLAAVGRRAGLPDPIVFALGGLALAVIPGIPQIALPPSIVLVIFLPPLIFAAAQDTSWAEMRQEARPILLLAVGLVLVTMGAVAAVARALAPELTWAAALTLGAIVAPPDAVAAKAIADTLRLPRRMVATLGGEGLVNDATALVAFQVASGAVVAGTVLEAGPAALRIVYAAVVSVAIGVAVGWAGRHVLTAVGEPAAENTVTLLLPFGAFLPAEALHGSGVLAVVALALYLSRFSVLLASSTSRLQGRVLWEMLDFLLTGLSFVLVGLQLRSSADALLHRPAHVLLVTAAVCLTVILVRPLWIFATTWLSDSVQEMLAEHEAIDRLTVPHLVVLSWAGMRGVISLAVALSLPQLTASGEPFPGRDLIVFVAFAVILVTLIGQGLTLPALIHRLGVGEVGVRTEEQEISARARMARAALERLDAIAGEMRASSEAVHRVGLFYATRVEGLNRQRRLGTASEMERVDEAGLREVTHHLLERLMDVERAELQRMLNDAVVDGPVARRLQRNLDLLRARDEM